jgi:hypothetical protein
MDTEACSCASRPTSGRARGARSPLWPIRWPPPPMWAGIPSSGASPPRPSLPPTVAVPNTGPAAAGKPLQRSRNPRRRGAPISASGRTRRQGDPTTPSPW